MRPHMGNAAAMWQALLDSHNDASVGLKLLVPRKLISCQMVDDDIDAHVINVEKLGSRLSQRCAKSPLPLDDIICAALGSSLPSDCNSTISSLLSQETVSSTVSSTVLASSLPREGIRRKDHASAAGTAFATKSAPQPNLTISPRNRNTEGPKRFQKA